MAKQMMMLTCTHKYLTTMVEEFTDQFSAIEGATVVLYGITNKEHVGFILIRWISPIPASFLDRLGTDVDVIDYVPYDAALHIL